VIIHYCTSLDFRFTLRNNAKLTKYNLNMESVTNLLPFEGSIIPGLHFDNCTIWVLKWDSNPTHIKEMVEVWILWHNGKKTCYISPSEANVVFQKYHDFDEIIPATITIEDIESSVFIEVTVSQVSILLLEILHKKTLKYNLLNIILRYANRNKIAEKGKTETGMNYKSIPKKINSIRVLKSKLYGENVNLIKKPSIQYTLGDGKSTKEPIINYCIHLLED